MESRLVYGMGMETWESDLAIVVEVGVESDSSLASGQEVHQHGSLGILLWEQHVKLKTAVGIRCVRWSSYQYLTERREREVVFCRMQISFFDVHKNV